MDAYRFSTSWARVMPDGKGAVNEEGLDFYDRLVDAMLARGLKPFQTLYHWEMPSALADLGGWTNRDVAKWFGDFTDVIMDRIGDRVESVATLNEPWCVSYLSHFLGHHAPGKKDIRATARAMHHVNLAHGEAMERLRARGQKNCGIVLNFDYAVPADDTPASPIFVTENGMAGDDHLADDAVADPIREKFVNDHIMATKDAIANGANVQGFFYWSLLDNYEWAFGYDKCFGIVHVDYETQVRTPKASYYALAQALKTNR